MLPSRSRGRDEVDGQAAEAKQDASQTSGRLLRAVSLCHGHRAEKTACQLPDAVGEGSSGVREAQIRQEAHDVARRARRGPRGRACTRPSRSMTLPEGDGSGALARCGSGCHHPIWLSLLIAAPPAGVLRSCGRPPRRKGVPKKRVRAPAPSVEEMGIRQKRRTLPAQAWPSAAVEIQLTHTGLQSDTLTCVR